MMKISRRIVMIYVAYLEWWCGKHVTYGYQSFCRSDRRLYRFRERGLFLNEDIRHKWNGEKEYFLKCQRWREEAEKRQREEKYVEYDPDESEIREEEFSKFSDYVKNIRGERDANGEYAYSRPGGGDPAGPVPEL